MRMGLFRQSAISFFTPGSLLLLIVALGSILRIYRFSSLSLWLDEGFTVYYSRLPWHTVLGLDGAYDVHPPLYYAFIKVVSTILPELIAGRLVSVVAGILTVPVLYTLARRLAGEWIGLLAGLMLAISPLHIWYSQEARQYTLVALLVCLSYLALVAFSQHPRLSSALAYFAVTLIALYVEYSAIYALFPQFLVILVVISREHRRALPIIVAVLGVVIGFLPWLPQLLRTAGNVSNEERLIVTPVKVVSSLLSIMGLAPPLQGQIESGGSITPVPAQTSGAMALYALLVLGALPAILAGVVVLAKLSKRAFLVMLCLFVGTLVTAIIISLFYPGYIKRALLPAILGWSLLITAAPFAAWLSAPLRKLAQASVLFCLAISVAFVGITYGTADKEHWRDLAADAAVVLNASAAPTSDELLVTYPTITDTLLDLYQPHLLDAPHAQVGDEVNLSMLESSVNSERPQTILLAYIELQGIDSIRNELLTLGYDRAEHRSYPGTLYLDTYTRR